MPRKPKCITTPPSLIDAGLALERVEIGVLGSGHRLIAGGPLGRVLDRAVVGVEGGSSDRRSRSRRSTHAASRLREATNGRRTWTGVQKRACRTAGGVGDLGMADDESNIRAIPALKS